MLDTAWPNGPPLVTELVNQDGTEWGVSFNGPNPEDKDYVPMKDRATAFKLRDLIQLYAPQSRGTIQAVGQFTNSAGSN